jgi:hypothetical protein
MGALLRAAAPGPHDVDATPSLTLVSEGVVASPRLSVSLLTKTTVSARDPNAWAVAGRYPAGAGDHHNLFRHWIRLLRSNPDGGQRTYTRPGWGGSRLRLDDAG